jgi:hypothetical protein
MPALYRPWWLMVVNLEGVAEVLAEGDEAFFGG